MINKSPSNLQMQTNSKIQGLFQTLLGPDKTLNNLLGFCFVKNIQSSIDYSPADWTEEKRIPFIFIGLSLPPQKRKVRRVRSIQCPHTQSHSRAHVSAVLGVRYRQHPSGLVARTRLPSELKLSRVRLFGSNTPINTSCCCNKPALWPIF